MFKKILVGVDGSESSKRAVEEAILLAKCGKSKVIFAAVDFQQMDSLEGWLYWKIEKAISLSLAASQKKAKAAKVSAEALVLEGIPADELLKLAKKQKADLIVVGNWGGSGKASFAKDAAGDIKRRLADQALCSVLIVR